MEEQNTSSKSWQDRMDEWKAKIEHLNVQLHLGAKEAGDIFEEQKKQLADWIHKAKKQIKDSKLISEEKTQELRTKLDELRVQAALGKAEGRDAIQEQQKKISLSMKQFRDDVEKTISIATEKEGQLEEDLKEGINDFKTRFDLFRLRSHLAQMDAEDLWNNKRKDLSSRLHNLKVTLEKEKESGSKKWKGFSKEMGEAWKHFVNAIDEAF
jgi:hypothetical protein